MLDMSKAFDTVIRKTLYEDLEKILNDDDLHMITILLKDVRLMTRCGHTHGQFFKTNTGVPQGDCLSPVLFTLYLAKALEHVDEESSNTNHDHTYSKPNVETEQLLPAHLQDHGYSIKQEPGFMIDQQYADDISWIATNEFQIEEIKKTVPIKLKRRNLTVNDTKTEQYKITRKGDKKWEKCKYLGSLLNTNDDINRRKRLAIVAYNKLGFILNSQKCSIVMKSRIFTAFISSIFLYNSELWTLNQKLENTIDVFQRSLLRKILNVTWADKVRNSDLYQNTKQEKWTTTIKTRRLRWYGHLMRLPTEVPAKRAVTESNIKVRRPPGRPPLTWKKQMENQLQEMGVKTDEENIRALTSDRNTWKALISGRAKSN